MYNGRYRNIKFNEMQIDSKQAIGVFDSGIGGLTVVRALMERLPFENIVYFGDTARVPYGVKSVETIAHYTTQIAQFLLEKNVKLLIIACNTMAAVAAQTVRDMSPVPVLDVIEAGAWAAVQASKTHQIGVIGTPTTVNSNTYARAIHDLTQDARIYSQACPLFVPLVEEGWLDHPVTRLTAQEYLKPVIAEHIDTLVLGCTHYPLIKPLLQEVMGEGVKLVDSAEAMANRTAALLAELNLANTSHALPHYEYYVTDVPVKFQTIGERFLGRSLSHLHVVKW
ncbi:glutamate racemase [Sulfuriferula nivalis]|uniref:Glutamate racemase n=2 Tax=Sulfuriferula nivalis TaxID=2675298 RepID=A0A809SGG3_9PROT|nr:glutamate racemase [Sulfuriferula nivalis]